MMKIKISGLKEGIHNFEYDGDVRSLELAEPFAGKYELNVTIDKSSHQLLLQAKGKAEAGFDCDRCGKEFKKNLEFAFSIVYMFQQNSDADFASESIVYITPDQDSINILPEIYDFAMLSLPMKVLCTEDCKGLCVKCGADLNETDCGCRNDNSENNSPFKDLKNLINN